MFHKTNLADDTLGVPCSTSRQEAVRYPSIFLAASNPYAVASTSYVQPASRAEELGIPSQGWRDKFLAHFVAMREVSLSEPNT